MSARYTETAVQVPCQVSWIKLEERDWKIRSTKVDAGNFKHELLNQLRSTMAVNVLIHLRFEPCTSQQEPSILMLHHPHRCLVPLDVVCSSFLETAYLGNGVESISDMGLATCHILLPTTMRNTWQWQSTDMSYGLMWDSRQLHPVIFHIPPYLSLTEVRISTWDLEKFLHGDLTEALIPNFLNDCPVLKPKNIKFPHKETYGLELHLSILQFHLLNN